MAKIMNKLCSVAYTISANVLVGGARGAINMRKK
jgi:hypothetical protein